MTNIPTSRLLATICVYPNFAATVSQNLQADNVKVACVSGGFPASQTFLEVKTVETALALADGADEIDMVLSVGAFLSGDYETCADEIAELKSVCGDHPLKVILETGELKTAELIKKASILSMYAGADFIRLPQGSRCCRYSRSCFGNVLCYLGIQGTNWSSCRLQSRWWHQDRR